MLTVANKPFILSDIMLNVVMLSVIMLNVVMLSVFMLNVVAPFTEIKLYNIYIDTWPSTTIKTHIESLGQVIYMHGLFAAIAKMNKYMPCTGSACSLYMYYIH
jgi:hypothetical protein